MKTMVGILCATAAACCLAAAKGPWIKGVTDKCPLDYKVGETMVFTLTLEQAESLPDGLEVEWTRTGDDGKTESGKVPAKAGQPLVVKTSLDRPGFVRIYALVRKADGSVWMPDGRVAKKDRAGGYSGSVFFDGGAGVDVAAIQQGVAEPADFDAFWARHKATLAAVPMEGVKLSELPSKNPKVKTHIKAMSPSRISSRPCHVICKSDL